MRSSLGALVVAVVLLLPQMSVGSVLSFTVVEPMGVDFGPAGAVFEGGTFEDIFIGGVFQQGPSSSNFSGEVAFDAGPVTSLTVVDATSRYEFGPGTLTLTGRWTDPIGDPVEGRYVAPLLGLVVDIRCEQQLSANDCGDVFGGSLGDAFASFGPGLFDDALADLLGLAPAGDAFSFFISLDGITGSPSSALRLSGSSRGQEEMEIGVTVPEPSALSLLLLAPLVARRFRRDYVRSRRLRLISSQPSRRRLISFSKPRSVGR